MKQRICYKEVGLKAAFHNVGVNTPPSKKVKGALTSFEEEDESQVTVVAASEAHAMKKEEGIGRALALGTFSDDRIPDE